VKTMSFQCKSYDSHIIILIGYLILPVYDVVFNIYLYLLFSILSRLCFPDNSNLIFFVFLINAGPLLYGFGTSTGYSYDYLICMQR
jgi:hypothetical protein